MNRTASDLDGELQAQQERRVLPVFFEVHYWPHEGRILTVNKVAHRPEPITTWLQLTRCDDVPLGDATTAIAAALAGAAAFEEPDARLVVHDRSGNILSTPAGLGLPVTVLRRAS